MYDSATANESENENDAVMGDVSQASLNVGDLIIVRLDAPEPGTHRRWAPAVIVAIADEPLLEIVYYQPEIKNNITGERLLRSANHNGLGDRVVGRN